jgi:alanine racemase
MNEPSLNLLVTDNSNVLAVADPLEVPLGDIKKPATWIEINRHALHHNLSYVAQLTGPDVSVLAVVKANAYGHGLKEIALSLHDRVTYLGVTNLEEAMQIRQLQIRTPILVFGMMDPAHVKDAIASDLSFSISRWEEAKVISDAALQIERSARVHIKIDTGMGRLGIPHKDARTEIEKMNKLKGLRLDGLLTHFAQGDDMFDEFTQLQISRFQSLIHDLRRNHIYVPFWHAANSIGISHFKNAHFNLVRPGLLLYGLKPSPKMADEGKLKPVLKWCARIVHIKKLLPGESTGYGRTFTAQEETTIGIIPVGYSHGYPFALSNKGVVLWRGRRFPVVGRVSMDFVAVNFGRSRNGIGVGDVVTLLGCDGDDRITAEELAELAVTIPYEIVTRLNPGILRMMTDNE